jgi:hypothetical protein
MNVRLSNCVCSNDFNLLRAERERDNGALINTNVIKCLMMSSKQSFLREKGE